MILVDKNIKALSAEGKLIKEAYTEENVNSISYDLTLGSFADKTETEKKLIPGATVIIKTKEAFCIRRVYGFFVCLPSPRCETWGGFCMIWSVVGYHRSVY